MMRRLTDTGQRNMHSRSKIVLYLDPINTQFLAPTGAQEVAISVCLLSVCCLSVRRKVFLSLQFSSF